MLGTSRNGRMAAKPLDLINPACILEGRNASGRDADSCAMSVSLLNMSSEATGRSDRIVRLSHWTVAALVALTVPIGFWMSNTYAAAQRDPGLQPRLHLLSAIHHTVGFTVLGLAGLWAAARAAGGRGAATAQMQPWRAALARTVHALLFMLLILLPLSGWSALSAFGDFPIYFGGYHLPGIVERVPFDDAHGYAFYAQIHRWGWKAGAGLLALHSVAAVWHQCILKDGVLARMWFGARSRRHAADMRNMNAVTGGRHD
jgi:cytochrome b561